ncbi:DUF3473 domain-containing protein [Desulfobulbus rhabdoformis]|uniref:XrtA system polysaccharide deacetylase n=1 Tax=Desulfobulbus rhabdoformis TaxID=34032 RepID=UPI00196400DE|nr:XrtA system polysaccharide deacetylase [Desulfobulbus rhabdoformis]MBM9616723.1 DUF3473 domain-containing protein [Desulfobulbus rhabdoformis]
MNPIINYLSIDVEDYFQVSAFENVIKSKKWETMEQRIEKNMETILNILHEHSVHATFFVVGWVAQKYPLLVKKINQQGHALGCHSYWHRKVYDLTQDEFREDTQKTKDILEDIIGQPIYGYRAPSYSVTKESLWAIDILKELGFRYDSSIFPIHHDRYGIPDAPRFPYYHANGLLEYPLSTLALCGQRLPIAGGGYFRLFPYRFSRWALKKINRQEGKPFVFYLHPWEVDPDQPRVHAASNLSKFRHYNQLHKTKSRFTQLLQDFKFQPIPPQNSTI